MQKSYIILAHKNASQLEKLITRLEDGESHFYIHIDKNTSINPFEVVLGNNQNVTFIKKREMGTWCDIGIVKGTINTLEQIIKDQRKGYCILLSGQDYPIKSNDYINKYLTENCGTDFIETFKIPTHNWFEDGLNRIHHHKFNLSYKRGHYIVCPTPFDKNFYKLQTLKSIVKLIKVGKFFYLYKLLNNRKHPKFINPYGGSQWWCLTIETAKKMIEYIDKHPKYITFHKYSLLPDEIFFHSIVRQINTVENLKLYDSLTFIDWERENTIGAPTFNIHDFDLLVNQPEHKLFARKFDYHLDKKIIEYLDKNSKK